MDAQSLVRLRKADVADIPFIMATERQPGFEWFVGRWEEARHRAEFDLPATAYLIGLDEAGAPQGFAILRQLDNPEKNIYLQRIAVAGPGRGVGRHLLRAVTDWVFSKTDAYRFWFHMKAGNDRARHVYALCGFTEDGWMRQNHFTPDGQRADALVLSMLRPEWSSLAASATT